MNRLWKLPESKSDKVVLVKNNTIYKGSVGIDKLNKLEIDSKNSVSVEKELFSIPYSYIKKIVNQKGIKYIKIFFGNDSEEELNVQNEKTKNEIFEFLKDDLKELNYRTELPNYLSYGKTQIFAVLILTGIFIWSMYYAIELSNGAVYELQGGGNPGLISFIFILANLGIPKLILGYSILVGIASFSLFQKLRTRSERQILER